MKEVLIEGSSLPEAYHKALIALAQYGKVADCADWGCTQKEVSMTMVVENPLAEPMISKLFIGGPKELEQYRLEMLDGILDFEIELGNWVYTYHDRMVNYPGPDGRRINQVQFVIDELKRSPSSRRAVILVRDTEDVGSEDPACLQHLQYFIRDGKLHSKILFRSNDACKATFMNAFAVILLQKRIADALGVEMGTYTHRASSFHCYEKDFQMLDNYVSRIESCEDEDDITFDYADGWDEIMEAEREGIFAQVEILKKQ